MQRRKLKEIYNDVITDFGGSNYRHSVKHILAKAIAGCCHMLYGYIEAQKEKFLPLTAKGSELDYWAQSYGLKRIKATQSTIKVEVQSNDKLVVPKGTRWYSGEYYFYLPYEAKIAGKDKLFLKSEKTGKLDPANISNEINIEKTIAGLETSALMMSFESGKDSEDDEELRNRLHYKMRKPPHGGSPYDYINWCKEAGSSKAWVLPLFKGPGTVAVSFVNEGDKIPEDLSTIEKVIVREAPAHAVVNIVKPKAKPILFVLELEPKEAYEEVKENLKKLLIDKACPKGFYSESDLHIPKSGTIYESDIHMAISKSKLEKKHKIQSPQGDIKVDNLGDMVVFGGLKIV